jgi:transcriptional regulatory protein LEU3
MAFIVCAVASRHYAGRPTLYDEASDAVKDAALSALLQPGGPTVDLCQAYIILAVYCPPAKHFQDDKAWTYVRIALRSVVFFLICFWRHL